MTSVPQSPPLSNPTLSVIIVGWNVRGLLRGCLESLRPAWAAGWAEVIVVDNASTDDTPAMVAAEFPAVRLIANRTNAGFGRANNQGMREARGAFFLLLNPDTVVCPGALDALVAFLTAHPHAGLVAPRLRNPDGSLQRNAFHFPGLAQVALDLFPLHPRLLEGRLNGRYPQERTATAPFPIDHPLGAALLVRRAVWEQTGGFDEGYFMYAEEVDWCRRIRQARWSIWQVPAAQIVHYGGQSTGQLPDRMLVELWRARLRYFRRHRSPAFGLAARTILRLGMLWRRAGIAWAARRGRLTPAVARARQQAARTVLRL